MQDGQRIAVIGGTFVALVAAAGVGAYALLGGGGGAGADGRPVAATGADTTASAAPTGPLSAKEVDLTAQGFLDAWAAGDIDRAAALTDDPAAATKALTGFVKDAKVSELTLTEGTRSGTKMPFTVDAEVTHTAVQETGQEAEQEAGQQAEPQKPTPWTYESELTVVRAPSDGKPVVDWAPAVLHPELGAGETIRTDTSGAPPLKMLDRNGTELTAEKHPALAGVLADLRKRYGTEAGGTAAVETRIVSAEGKPGKTLHKHSKGTPGTIRTTLDSGLQRAAEQAVAGKAKASVAAVRPSTGEILALANSPAKGFDTARLGSYAPGSTMKIVTSAMLMEKGLARTGAPHPCPKYFTYGGWKFHNDKKFEIPGGTFDQSFARSCNTAFISQAPELTDDALGKEARDVFGIGLNWQAGVATFDGRVPVESDAQMGASLIGQGGVRVSPLVMASVSATVKDGTFRQPYLVDPSFDNRALAQAPRSLKPGVAQQLRGLMRLTATGGTAAQAMAGLSGDFGAKTGSAEVDGQEKPNAWFTAYRNDLAASAVVPNSGHGGEFAGPVVRQVLAAGG